ncbi:helix-turn-helix domain-containing protein [Gulosibacter molinativorax]|uniref:XRE family transcriptional regulator n=1 Tax=Gulosibacter molinativorax TaxID=256821 RepID=A0ABT7C993_9MICO|nr:helix-turn-helix transcriptional regulator [Gulosibacter molinativorax]MDJ1371784.1 XRE family transcriptional regulator [Gulosibacter molinativorax]QUY60845.1 Hypotetical protein [Gulosibacter molinativorax]
MTYNTWLSIHTNGASTRDIAAKADVAQSTLSRQLSGSSSLDAALVVKIARAYNLSVLDALVAAGFITSEEANIPPIAAALESASDVEIAREILRRAEDSEQMGLPVSEAARARSEYDGNVIPADSRFSMPVSVLADLEGEPYAADTRRDHEDDPIED